MNILAIRDDKPGHYNQTEGLLLSLKELYPDAKIEYCDIEIKSKISRKLLRLLLNILPSFFTNKDNIKYINKFYKNFSIPKINPDIIVSTGGNTSNINAWFSHVYGAKNILNGALRGLKEDHFTYITTVLDLGYTNQIILDVAPNTITQKLLFSKAEEFTAQKNIVDDTKLYSLLIGGDGSGYTYDEKFYLDLISFIDNIAHKNNIKWLITTSRRTSLKIENLLKSKISSDICLYFVEYNKKPEKVLLPFLGLSEAVFVTEESASMISESISSGKPTYTISANTDYKESNYQKLLEKFENDNYICKLKVDSHLDLLECNFSPFKKDTYILIASKLKMTVK